MADIRSNPAPRQQVQAVVRRRRAAGAATPSQRRKDRSPRLAELNVARQRSTRRNTRQRAQIIFRNLEASWGTIRGEQTKAQRHAECYRDLPGGRESGEAR